jgi:hypothetical protein
MAFTLTNIFTAEPLTTGVAFVAPLGTELPSDPIAELSSISPNWVDLGYTGTDGFIESNNRKIELKFAFGGNAVKILQSEYSATLKFTFMESINADVLSAVFGPTNVTVTEATSEHGTQVQVFKNSRKLPFQSWCIDTFDDELNAKYRNVAPNAAIGQVADIKVVHSDVIEYQVTLECFESGASTLDNIITFIDNGITTGS